MALKTGLVVIFSTTLILVQSSPIQRDREENQELEEILFEATLPPSEYSDWHNETRQRDKERRLKAIEMFILEALGRANKAPASSIASPPTTTLSEVNPDGLTLGDQSVPRRIQYRSNNHFPGQLGSFEASCELPSKVDSETWMESGTFRIFVNISKLLENSNNTLNLTQGNLEEPPTTVHPRSQIRPVTSLPLATLMPHRKTLPTPPATTVNVVSAKLRLYKIGRGPNAEPAKFDLPKISEFCNNTNDQIAANHQTQGQLPSPSRASGTILSQNLARAEERIFVKVYWYIAPITKHHYKKKLLYSGTLLVKESGWIDFDIQKAAKMWLESKVNYGLNIEVENEDNDLVDANMYFSNVQCPITGTTVPGRELVSASAYRRSNPTPEPFRYPAPILELCTLTIPFSPSTDPVRRAVSYRLSDLGLTDESHENVYESQIETSTTTLPPYLHRRRHHHGSDQRSALSARNTHFRDFGSSMQGDSPMVTESPPPETTTTFHLDGDHPLKRIFATAKSYLSRDELMNRRRKQGMTNLDEDPLSFRFQPIILEAENIVFENTRTDR